MFARKINKIMLLSMLVILAAALSGCAAKRSYSIELLNKSEDLTYINGSDITGIGDPYMVTYNNMYYMTATTDGSLFNLYSSPDMKNWTLVSTIFQTSYTDGWVRSSLWQPQIVIGKDGKFYLYYCGTNDDGSLRIGVAGADSIEGPYVDLSNKPLFDLGYATIDPNLYVDDDGKMYLYYSRDCSENFVDGFNTSQIYVVEMESYTKVKQGAEHKLLLTPKQDWEINSGAYRWNEGPDLLKHDNKYYLFYSANYYEDWVYSIGYAVSDSPEGPFVKYENNPVLSATDEMSGPGNNSFFYSLDKNELFTAYHTHTDPMVGGGDRKLTIDRCGFHKDGTFYVNGPTNTEQPLPSGERSLVKDIAEVKVSSSTEGKSPELLTDGAISKNKKDLPYEWTVAAGDSQNSIEVTFEQAKELEEIVLYRCFDDKSVPKSLKIILDDGGTIENVRLTENSTEPVILNFDPVETKHVKIIAQDLGSAENFGLAEIMFFSK